MLMCISRKKGPYPITVGIRSGRSALIRMKAMLFLKGDSNSVTVELESTTSTSVALETPLSGICALPSESQMIMTIVRNVERPVVIWRFQCCNDEVNIVLYSAVQIREILPLRKLFRRPGLAMLEEPVPELNPATVLVVLLPCRAM